jgi:antitoxin (DNA-binding transcriptional repressor) of toxin-antitoxin stability system
MSKIHNTHDAETDLSRLAERASRGEEIVIARNGQALAKLVPIEVPRKPRKLGLWKDKHVWVSDDFDESLPWEDQRYFEDFPILNVKRR